MRVIDGEHRLMAARLKGRETIEVEFFEGTSEDAFLRAVQANVSHGLPLSNADRRAAADRILRSHPHMSDRAIARASGLGTDTVARLRRRAAGAAEQPEARIGRDGKVRPLSSAEGRWRAAELMREHPDASLREVARQAGISPGTAGDVRRRLQAGRSPVVTGTKAPAASGGDRAAARWAARRRRSRQVGAAYPDYTAILEKLLRDPALRQKEEGRQLLWLLRQNAIDTREWSDLTAVVPMHCGTLVVDLARQCAEIWVEFAQELDQRVRSVDDSAASG